MCSLTKNPGILHEDVNHEEITTGMVTIISASYVLLSKVLDAVAAA